VADHRHDARIVPLEDCDGAPSSLAAPARLQPQHRANITLSMHCVWRLPRPIQLQMAHTTNFLPMSFSGRHFWARPKLRSTAPPEPRDGVTRLLLRKPLGCLGKAERHKNNRRATSNRWAANERSEGRSHSTAMRQLRHDKQPEVLSCLGNEARLFSEKHAS